MIRAVKFAVCAAVLAAVTITAHANLIVVGTVINEPTSFSATFHWNPGQGGDTSYSSEAGANWGISVSLSGEEITGNIRHITSVHGPSEISPSTGGAVFAYHEEDLIDSSGTVDHGNIPGHTDTFNFTFGPLTPTSPILVLTITAFHSPGVTSVPDAASTVMLLGLTLTGLGTVRRFIRY